MRAAKLDEQLIAAVEPLIIWEPPCITLNIDLLNPGIAPGCTKAGGIPDLPKNVAWPDPSGEPYTFLFQVNLSDIDGRDTENILPKVGLLSFFISEYQEHASVLYSQSIEQLQPAPLHDMFPSMDVSDSIKLYLGFEQSCIPPRYDSPAFQALDLSQDQQYSFEDFEYELDESDSRIKNHIPSRLLGPCLDDIGGGDLHQKVSCELRIRGLKYSKESELQVRDAAQQWRILAMMDPFEKGSPLRSNTSLNRRLFFWIRHQDLAGGDFGKVQLVIGES